MGISATIGAAKSSASGPAKIDGWFFFPGTKLCLYFKTFEINAIENNKKKKNPSSVHVYLNIAFQHIAFESIQRRTSRHHRTGLHSPITKYTYRKFSVVSILSPRIVFLAQSFLFVSHIYVRLQQFVKILTLVNVPSVARRQWHRRQSVVRFKTFEVDANSRKRKIVL